jgi:hypothetical protein
VKSLTALVLSAFALVPAAISGAAVSAPAAAAPPKPSVVKHVYVSPSGSDARACSSAAPCASFTRAYQVAAAGQVVEIRAGSYPPQSIPLDPAKAGSARVVFQPAPGAAVLIQPTGIPWGSALEITARHVAVRNIRVADRWSVFGGADDVKMTNVSSQRFFIGSASNVSVHGGQFGPFLDSAGAGGSHVWADSDGSPDPQNILLDGITMHDYTIPAGSGFHLDCLTIGGGSNITLQRSRFTNCNGFDAWTKPYPKTGSNGPTGLRLVNNVFGPNLAGTPQVVSLACADSGSVLHDITVEYNSFGGQAALGTNPFPCTRMANVVFRANILPQINPVNCGVPGFISTYNIVRENPCGATDSRYVSSAFWRKMPLSSGCSRAVGHGDPKHYPKRDVRGVLRGRGKRPDAGAYENRLTKKCKFGHGRRLAAAYPSASAARDGKLRKR